MGSKVHSTEILQNENEETKKEKNGNRKTKNMFSSVTCRSRCRHFGDVKLKCEKQRNTWELAHGEREKKKMSVTLTDSEIDGTFSH